MESMVVYHSQFGNTRTLAEAIAAALQVHGRVRLFGLDREVPLNLGRVDLLVVGGPTQAHGMTGRMRQFLDELDTRQATGVVAAAFDTRYRMPVFLSGSAARAIASNLCRLGFHLFVPPESFFVTRGTPQLEDGEAEQAKAWATSLATRLALASWSAA